MSTIPVSKKRNGLVFRSIAGKAAVTRREFITLVGGAAVAWPLPMRAQPALPVVGFLRSTTLKPFENLGAAFQQGLKEAGFVEGQNVAIEYRYAENQLDRLPGPVADLLRRSVAVIVGDTLAAFPVKAATSTVPIVFATGGDPVRSGLVDSLSRPGGNVTGVVFFGAVLGAKRLELLRQLVPRAATIGMLVDPNSPSTEAERKDVQAAAEAIRQQLVILEVSNEGEIETAVGTLAQRGIGCAAGRRRHVPGLQSGANCSAGGPPSSACDLPPAGGRIARRPDELRAQHCRCLSPSRSIRRPHSQRRKTGRPSRH
jgi:hypothetical protein